MRIQNLKKKEMMYMKYSKPKVVAQNATEGSYAAGCPSEQMGNDYVCRKCDRTK